jgi:hypothetical protein
MTLTLLVLGMAAHAAAEGPRPGRRTPVTEHAAGEARATLQPSDQIGDDVYVRAIARSHDAQRGNATDGAAGGGGGISPVPIVVGVFGLAGLAIFFDALHGHSSQLVVDLPLTPGDPHGGAPKPPVNPDPVAPVTPTGSGDPPSTGHGNPPPPPPPPPNGGWVPPPPLPETTAPEPVSMALVGSGLAAMGGMTLRRRYRDWKSRTQR